MPYLNMRLSTPLPDGAPARIAALLTDLTAEVLRKKRELTAVVIDPVPADHWFIGGAPLGARQAPVASFYLDIKVTEGTNTKDEKAAYVQRVFAGMQSILSPLDPASYVVIHEVRADAWGYGGATQEFRYVAGKRL